MKAQLKIGAFWVLSLACALSFLPPLSACLVFLAIAWNTRLPAMRKMRLLNGQSVWGKNLWETRFVEKECIGSRIYLKAGIEVSDGDTVLDIGANTGLFSTGICSEAKQLNVFAFEPIPALHQVFQANAKVLSAEGHHVELVKQGVSDTVTPSVEFNFCHSVTVTAAMTDISWKKSQGDDQSENGGAWALIEAWMQDLDELAPTAAVTILSRLVAISKSFTVLHWICRLVLVLPWVVAIVLNLVLHSEVVDCSLTTLDSFFAAHPEVDKVKLIKIDVEGAEVAVLRGCSQKNFDKVEHIVAEVEHENLTAFETLLHERGFTTHTNRLALFHFHRVLPFWAVYATRS